MLAQPTSTSPDAIIPISDGDLIVPSMPIEFIGDATNTKNGSISGLRRKKPHLQLKIPGENNLTPPSESTKTTTDEDAIEITHTTNSKRDRESEGQPRPLPRHAAGNMSRTPSINLLRTASAESSNGGMTPMGTLISPNNMSSQTPLNTPSGMPFLIPGFQAMSLLSPNVAMQPLSPNVSGLNHHHHHGLTRMASSESATVKIIDADGLPRSDSLTSTTSFPSVIRPQPGTPGFGQQQHAQPHHHHPHTRGWTAVETPRLSSGHYVPFPPLISPTPARAAQQYFGATTAAGAPQPPSVPMMPSPQFNYQSHHRGHPQQQPQQHPHHTSSYPVFQTTWQVMSSVPSTVSPSPALTRPAHVQQQVHHGHVHHHHHHHRGPNVGATHPIRDLYGGMKDGSGVSSSLSVGTSSTPGSTGATTGGGMNNNNDRSAEFYQMKMQAKNAVGSMPVCRHWVKGTCWYGATCKFRHPDDE